MNIGEHDVVVLTQDLSEHGLCKGDVGAVVYAYADGKAYEVEFVTGSVLAHIVTPVDEHVYLTIE